MEDVAPKLYEQIKAVFDEYVLADQKIQDALNNENTKATFEDVSIYSRRLGTYATKSIRTVMTEEALPDGKFYWNIMERTIVPLMKEVYELVNQMAFNVQRILDAKQKIGIKPQKAEFPLERVEAVMNRIMNIQEGAAYGDI